MGELSRFDFLLMFVAAFVAVTSLVKLMRVRRDWLVNQVQRQLDEELARRKRQKQKEQEEQRKAA